jgi:dephospho-CoA kinase
MSAFGEKTYMMAQGNGRAIGVIAFLVENLVTRVDDFVIDKSVPFTEVGKALITAMEKASGDLQSEVAFVFLPNTAAQQKQIFTGQGYEEINVDEIRIPAWREAVTESRPADTIVLTKRLREKLVLKPI